MFHSQRTKKTAILQESPLFRGLPVRELRLVEQHADLVDVSAGETVANPCLIPREFVAVQDGMLSARSNSEVVTLHAGDSFGAFELLARRPRPTTVVAKTPASLIVIEARSFVYLMESIPALERRVMGRIIQDFESPAA
jgi:CRP-like cAMP-binding protein